MEIIGTSHFFMLRDAVRYYRAYGFTRADVEKKIKDGEIHLGPPTTPHPCDRLRVNTEGRYEIMGRDLG